MKVIIKSELARFKTWVLTFAVLHFLVLVLINSLTGLLRNSVVNLLMLGVLYIGSAALFGLYQFASYKKPNQWAYLIHRPLSAGKILNSLILVAMGLFTTVFIIPLAAFYVGLDLFSQQIVEPRHYMFLPFVFLLMVNFYLAACFAVLHPKRIALVTILAPFVFLFGFGKGFELFAWLVGSGVVLLLMAQRVFKPDLNSNIDKPLDKVLTVYPIQLCLYYSIALITFVGGEMLMYALNVHPYSNPAPDSYYQIYRNFSEPSAMKWTLEGASEEDIDRFESQTEISEMDTIGYSMAEFPIRQQKNQPHVNDKNGFFIDKERQIIWSFSHQQMLYKGSAARGQEPGWLGRNGIVDDLSQVKDDDRFAAIPIAQDNVVITQTRVYFWDSKQQTLHLRYQLPSGEEFYSAPEYGKNFVGLFSNSAMYMFDKRRVTKNSDTMIPFARIELPRKVTDLLTPRVAELADGFLISFAFGDPRLAGSYINSENYLYFVDYSGESRLVNQRPFVQSVPAWHRYNDFMVSPAFAIVEQYAKHPGHFLKELETEGQLILFIVTLTIVLIATVILYWSRLSFTNKVFWFIAAAIGGIPGIITLWFLSDWKTRTHLKTESSDLNIKLANA